MKSGVILAETSFRPDVVKASLEMVDGERLIDRQISEMKKFVQEIVLVTNDPRAFLPVVSKDIRIITVFHKEKGILGALHAGMSLAQHPQVWLGHCDSENVSSKAAKAMDVRLQQTGSAAVVPFFNQTPLPFQGIYQRKQVLETLSESINLHESISFSEWFRQLDWTAFDEMEYHRFQLEFPFKSR
ncbi:molybdenum cofactor guanylyltransferase [Virgibacillus senegalensis]|uniref:molybdenum cofactor guanylyltransferase n=1 Tax=Virgibacillus senegalensis TaxID=1499679 RepID=UPI00069F7A1E|nr:NTP transferase domain-containing protein [Virgibacillus senegalensis]